MKQRGSVMLAAVLGLAVAVLPEASFAQKAKAQPAGCRDVGAPLLVCGEKPSDEKWPHGARELFIDDRTCPPGQLKRYTENARTGAPMESCVADPRPRR